MSTVYMLVIYNHRHEREEIHSGIPAAIFDEVAKDCQPDDYMHGTLKARNDDAAFDRRLIRAATAKPTTAMHFDTDAKPVLWGVLNSVMTPSIRFTRKTPPQSVNFRNQQHPPQSSSRSISRIGKADVLNFAH